MRDGLHVLESDDLRRQVVTEVLSRVDASADRSSLETAGFLGSIRNVVVVVSSSRSGSSFLTEQLKLSRHFLNCPGEINPYLQLAQLAWPESGSDSDALGVEHCSASAREIVERHLAAEVGFTDLAEASPGIDEVFCERLFRRLCLQWPLETFTIEDVRAAARRALRSVEAAAGRRCDWSSDLAAFHLRFLIELRAKHPRINPYYYDLDRTLIGELLPDMPVPSGPPSPIVIEEPPFILIRPWARWDDANLADRPLVIKTPSNAYRLDFLRALMPAARFRILHLTRNPGAAVNGLCDGWRHWGFHSHRVGEALRVPGYSQPGSPDFGWWKFDLPPGWQAYRGASLERLCGFQWSTAHRSILDYVRHNAIDYRRIRFEDVLGGFSDRPDVLGDLRAWLGDEHFLEQTAAALAPVMSTHPPRPGRWRVNADRLQPVFRDESVRSVAEALGYHHISEWI